MAAASAVLIPKSTGRSSFTNQEIARIADGSRTYIASWVRSTAKERRITYREKAMDSFARAASRLSDADADLDPIEDLLIALRRAHVITPFQRGLLQVQYLR